jgi:hypothetical protein
MKSHIITATAILYLPVFPAWAAGPYIVDDADIVDPNMVQIESWYSHSNKDENISTINAAYQLLPHTEVTLQEGHDAQSPSGEDLVSGQVKYQWLDDNKNRHIAAGTVLGISDTAQSQHYGFYAYVPTTVAISGTIDLNTDFGWQHTENQPHYFNWGMGTVFHATDTVLAIGEIFGKNEGRPGLQLGPRVTVFKSVLLDAVYGHNITGATGNWLTAGITMAF